MYFHFNRHIVLFFETNLMHNIIPITREKWLLVFFDPFLEGTQFHSNLIVQF